MSRAKELLQSAVNTPAGVTVQLWVAIAVVLLLGWFVLSRAETWLDGRFNQRGEKISQLEGQLSALRGQIKEDVKAELDSRKRGDTVSVTISTPIADANEEIGRLQTATLPQMVAEWNKGL